MTFDTHPETTDRAAEIATALHEYSIDDLGLTTDDAVFSADEDGSIHGVVTPTATGPRAVDRLDEDERPVDSEMELRWQLAALMSEAEEHLNAEVVRETVIGYAKGRMTGENE